MASIVAVAVFTLVIISPDIQARKLVRPVSFTSSPEIWLSTFSEIDSFEETPAEAEFRTRPQFHNDFVFKNGTDYVVLDSTETATFTCQSQYPVEWDVPHIEQVQHVSFFAFQASTSRISQFYPNSVKPTNKYFETLLTVRFSYFQFFNANFTCTAKTNTIKEYHGRIQPLSSSIHLFYAGQQAIERKDETIQVYMPYLKEKDTSGESTIILPCRPATPNVTILLEKQMENSNNPSKENATKTWKDVKFLIRDFDPKVGFHLIKDHVVRRSNIFGLYRCIAMEDNNEEEDDQELDASKREADSQIVYINIVSIRPENQSSLDIGFEAMVKLEANASVSYNNKTFGQNPVTLLPDHSNLNELICCSGIPDNPPVTHAEMCDDRFQCKLLQLIMERRINSGDINMPRYYYSSTQSFNRSDCQRYPLGVGTTIICKGSNIQFMGTFTTVFADGLMPVANRSWGSLLTKYETEASAKKGHDSQNILFTVGYPITTDELILDLHYNRYSGKVFTLTEKHYIEQDAEKLMYVDQTDVVQQCYEEYDYLGRRLRFQESLSDKIAEYPRDVYYEMEPLVLVCMGWKRLYSKGAYLTISWKNGSVTPVENAGKNGKHYKTVYFYAGVNGNLLFDSLIEYRIGKEVLAQKDMVSLECWMPQANTNEWDKIVKNLTIFPGSLPQFVEGEGSITEQVVYLYLGEDEGKQLECHVVGGAPKPKLNVTKDGKGIFNPEPLLAWRINENENFTRMINVTLQSKDIEDKNGTTATIDDGVTTLIIQFGKVTHEMQGVYQCTAGNVRGIVTRTFRVVVVEKRSVILPIVLTSIIFSCVILIGMGVRHWLQQKNIQSLRQSGTH